MLFHSAEDPRLAEMVFRTVQNSAAPTTATGTASAIGQIALGMPVVLEINTASTPNSDGTINQNYVTKPAAAGTAPINNLMLGVLVRVPGKVNYLAQDAVGLVQCYGPVLNALVRRDAAGVTAGTLLQPSDIGFINPGTAGPPAGQAGQAVLIEALAASSASEVTPAKVFLRCM